MTACLAMERHYAKVLSGMRAMRQICGIAFCALFLSGCGMMGDDETLINTPMMLRNLQGTWVYRDADTGSVQTLKLKAQGLGSLQVDNQARPLTFHWMVEGADLVMRYYEDTGNGFQWGIVEDHCGYTLRGNLLELKRGRKTLLMRRTTPGDSAG